MSIDMLLVILLVWTVAGLLAAIAFGKVARQASPDEEESLASSAGTIKYIRRNKDKARDTSVHVAGSRRGAKHVSS
jgi:hypothetical protein